MLAFGGATALGGDAMSSGLEAGVPTLELGLSDMGGKEVLLPCTGDVSCVKVIIPECGEITSGTLLGSMLGTYSSAGGDTFLMGLLAAAGLSYGLGRLPPISFSFCLSFLPLGSLSKFISSSSTHVMTSSVTILGAPSAGGRSHAFTFFTTSLRLLFWNQTCNQNMP